MFARRRNRGTMRWGSVSAVLLVLTLLGAMAVAGTRAPTVRAQEGTPSAGDCVAPELPPGTPTPMEEGTPADMAGMDMGTPAAEEPAATPEPTEAPAGTPAADDAAAEATAAVENLANCFNTNVEGYVALHTEAGLLDEFGTANPYDAVASLQEFPPPPVTLLSLDNVQTFDDGRISVDFDYTIGPYQYYRYRVYLVQEGEYWLWDDSVALPADVEGDTAAFGVTLTEYAFTPNVASVVATDVLIIQGTNAGVEPHEIAIARLPEGADPAGLLDGSIPMEQVELIGQIFVEPGGLEEMVLLNLPPGVYTMVCFVPAPDGTPHIALGMVTTFEVTAPEPVATPAA
jgi:hypothetical protein